MKNIILKVLATLFIAVGVVCADAKAAEVSPEYRKSLKLAASVVAKYSEIFKAAGRKYNVDPLIGAGIMAVETHGKCRNHKTPGAKGCMQVKEIAFKEVQRVYGKNEFGDNLNDVKTNIFVAFAYFAWMRDNPEYSFDYLEYQLVAYKDGNGNAEHMSRKKVLAHDYIQKFWAAMDYLPQVMKL